MSTNFTYVRGNLLAGVDSNGLDKYNKYGTRFQKNCRWRCIYEEIFRGFTCRIDLVCYESNMHFLLFTVRQWIPLVWNNCVFVHSAYYRNNFDCNTLSVCYYWWKRNNEIQHFGANSFAVWLEQNQGNPHWYCLDLCVAVVACKWKEILECKSSYCVHLLRENHASSKTIHSWKYNHKFWIKRAKIIINNNMHYCI